MSKSNAEITERAKKLCGDFRKSKAFKNLRVGEFYYELEKFGQSRSESKKVIAVAKSMEKAIAKKLEEEEEDWEEDGEDVAVESSEVKPEVKQDHIHVDEFVESHYGKDKYARWFFFLARLAATYRIDWDDYIKQFKLFCTFEGKRYRVTGASRLGDIWLTSNFDQDTGYEKRVFLEQCSDWSPTPDIVLTRPTDGNCASYKSVLPAVVECSKYEPAKEEQ